MSNIVNTKLVFDVYLFWAKIFSLFYVLKQAANRENFNLNLAKKFVF